MAINITRAKIPRMITISAFSLTSNSMPAGAAPTYFSAIEVKVTSITKESMKNMIINQENASFSMLSPGARRLFERSAVP